MNAPALLLSRADVRALLTRGDYLDAVERAFSASKQSRAHSPSPMLIPATGGGFHAKGASFTSDRAYVALKFNGNFPGNLERTGLPTIQGAIMLCDAHNGSLLAIMDSIEITLMRTAAASALAARYLARPDAATLSIVGCGDQAVPQASAIADVIALRHGYAWDIDAAKAARFAKAMSRTLGIPSDVPLHLSDATRRGDIIVTCTTSRSPVLGEADVSPGAFIAAIGADSPGKSEIAPSLMARSAVIVDVLDQCVAMGDLRQAVAAGAMSAADVRCDLGDLVSGRCRGRTHEDEIVIFDSTGTAIQDAASAALAYERASRIDARIFDFTTGERP
jgi:alanine dehydrogenase